MQDDFCFNHDFSFSLLFLESSKAVFFFSKAVFFLGDFFFKPWLRQGRRVDSTVEFLDFLCPSAVFSNGGGWRLRFLFQIKTAEMQKRCLSQYTMAVEYHYYLRIIWANKNSMWGFLTSLLIIWSVSSLLHYRSWWLQRCLKNWGRGKHSDGEMFILNEGLPNQETSVFGQLLGHNLEPRTCGFIREHLYKRYVTWYLIEWFLGLGWLEGFLKRYHLAPNWRRITSKSTPISCKSIIVFKILSCLPLSFKWVKICFWVQIKYFFFCAQNIPWNMACLETSKTISWVARHLQIEAGEIDSWKLERGWELQVSNEKNPGCLGYIGDEILPSYMGIIINHCKYPY